MDTLKLHSHFENLLYVGRSVLTNTSSRIQRLFFKKEMCIYEYLFKEEASKGIEIVVDNAVLVCVFENDICNKSILYLNDSTNVTLIIAIVLLNMINFVIDGLCLMVILPFLCRMMTLKSDLHSCKP